MGSFGAVYRATNLKVGSTVAVKILKPDLGDDESIGARELFQREALTAGRLSHRHIIAVTDVDEDCGFAYLVMEWLDGRTLENELRTNGRMDAKQTVEILEQIADALQTAHESGVIHRDIKPSNIHLGKHPKPFIKMIDFGIAKVITSSTAAAASRIAGTLAYMSPEQISGSRIDRRSDIYSLGIMLYQMLSGELPFKGDSHGQLVQQHLLEPPPQLSEVRPDLGQTLSQVIDKALAKNPEDRHDSVQTLFQEFAKALQGSTTVVREPELERPRPMAGNLRSSKTEHLPQVKTAPSPDAPRQLANSLSGHSADHANQKTLPIEPSRNTTPSGAKPVKSFRERISNPLFSAICGGVTFFILSVMLKAIVDSFYNYSSLYSSQITLRDTLFGVFFGLTMSEVVRPSRWSINASKVRAIVTHGSVAAMFAMLVFVPLAIYRYLFGTPDLYTLTGANDFLRIGFRMYERSAEVSLLPISFGFVVGVVIYGLRRRRQETERQRGETKVQSKFRYATVYSVVGAVSLGLFSLLTIRVENTGPLTLRDALFGFALGLTISELRPSALWSTRKGRRLKAFVAYGATGSAVGMLFSGAILSSISGWSTQYRRFYFEEPLRLGGYGFVIGSIVYFLTIVVRKSKRKTIPAQSQ
jgi:serine/threonine protein kinase